MEYWYDIYGLSENRNAASIETFLCHFADRDKIESGKRDIIALMPDVPLVGTINLLRNRAGKSLNPSELTYRSHPTYTSEKVRVDTLSEAIELGVSRRDHAFSIFIPRHIRKGLKSLLVHFTLDRKVILGVSVDEKDSLGEDNFSFAKRMKHEMEEVLPFKTVSVWFDHQPPDNEAEFTSTSQYFKDLSEKKKEFSKNKSHVWHDIKGDYHMYQTQLHQNVRILKEEFLYAPFLSDYFAIGDHQDNLFSLERLIGDHQAHNESGKTPSIDVAKVPSLGDLLERALLWQNRGFIPAKIYKVSIPPEPETENFWQGFRDRVSKIIPPKGKKAREVIIEHTYYLNDIGDIKELAAEGFFEYRISNVYGTTVHAYEEWLIQNQQAQLYQDLLQKRVSFLGPNTYVLLQLVGKQDWEKFLFCLHQFKLSKRGYKRVIDQMSRDGQWTTQQLEDIFQLVNLTEPELDELLHNAFRANLFDFYKLFYSKRKKPLPLQNLITAIKQCLENKSSPEAHKFINFFLQEIEKHYGTFCDYPLILTLAGPEKDQDLLISVLKLLPEENRHSHTLLTIGLAFENEYILRTSGFALPAMEKGREEETALIENKKEDLVTLIRKATLEGNYFQVEFLASQIAPNHLEAPLVEAAQRGMVGIVKVLVEQGNVAPDCWFNYPIKFANKSGFLKLKQYLLSKGVKDEEFEQAESPFSFGQHDHLNLTTLILKAWCNGGGN